jgi:hypothetical protein
VSKQPIGVDYLQYLATLATSPEQSISRIYSMDGAGLYKVTDEHYVCVECIRCQHRGRALLERVLPRDWECFYSAVNTEDGFEVYHYGPPA